MLGSPGGSPPISLCTIETDVAADPGRTFAYPADASKQAEWRHDVATCELTEGAPGAVGAVYRQSTAAGGRLRHHGRGARRVDHLGLRRGDLTDGAVGILGARGVKANHGGGLAEMILL